MNRIGLMTSMAMVGTAAGVAFWPMTSSSGGLTGVARSGTQPSIWAPGGVHQLQQAQIDGLPISPVYDHGFVFAPQEGPLAARHNPAVAVR